MPRHSSRGPIGAGERNGDSGIYPSEAGERLTLAASVERPITVAWRVPAGGSPAARLEVSDSTLTAP